MNDLTREATTRERRATERSLLLTEPDSLSAGWIVAGMLVCSAALGFVAGMFFG